MDALFPGHTYDTVVLALQWSMSSIRNDYGIKQFVMATTSANWSDNVDGARRFIDFINHNNTNTGLISAARNAVAQTSAAFLLKGATPKPVQSPQEIIRVNRPSLISAIAVGKTHSAILSHMPAANSVRASGISTLASNEPEAAANQLLDLVGAQELWGEFTIGLAYAGHRSQAALFDGQYAGPAPASTLIPDPAPSMHDDGDVFQLRQAPSSMDEFIMVSLAHGSNIVVIPARKFPGGLRTKAIARQYLDTVDETNSPKNAYYGTKLGVYKRIFHTGTKTAKSKIVENAEFGSDSDDEEAEKKKRPSKTTVMVDAVPAPRLKPLKVVRGGVTRYIQMDQGLPKYLIVARDHSGLYESVTPGDDEPGLSTAQEAVDFASRNKRGDKTSEYGVYVLGPSNVVEEEEVFMIASGTLVEKRAVGIRPIAKTAAKTAAKSTPKTSALPIPKDDEDISD
jgi:hypothetical protein